MKIKTIVAALMLIPMTAVANPFAEVRSVEIQEKAETVRVQQAQQKAQFQREMAATRERQRQNAIRQEREKAIAAERSRRQGIAERRDEEQYQLELESQRLDLQAKRAMVNHTDDYINADLKRSNAQTDVVQSQADANRNISSGIQVNLSNKKN